MSPQNSRTKVLWMIWTMLFIFSLFYIWFTYRTLVGDLAAGQGLIEPDRFFTFTDPLDLPFTLTALMLFGASFALPSLVAKNTKTASSDLVRLILKLALIEGGILLGFALAMVKKDFTSGAPLFGLGLFLFLLASPRKSSIATASDRGTLT